MKPTPILSTALALSLALLLSTCAPHDIVDPNAGTTPTDDPILALDPQTPLAFGAAITAFGTKTDDNGNTRDAATTRTDSTRTAAKTGIRTDNTPLTAADLAQIPAKNEITAGSEIKNSYGGIYLAEILLPGATTPFNNTSNECILYLNGGTAGDITHSKFYIEQWSTDDAVAITPRLKDLNLKAETPDGTPQPHSRIALMHVTSQIISSRSATRAILLENAPDHLAGIALLGHDADGASTSKPAFNFRLRHTRAKLSVLLQTKTGEPIDVGNSNVLNYADVYVPATACEIICTTPPPDKQGGYPALMDYLRPSTPEGAAPMQSDDPTKLDDQHIQFAIYGTGGEFYTLSHPSSSPSNITVPTNLLNGIIPASATHRQTRISPLQTEPSPQQPKPSYVPLTPNSPQHYSDDDYLAFELKDIVDTGTGEDTDRPYFLNLKDIPLTGLPADDPRCVDASGQPIDDGTGRLLYLLPGEHLVLTLRVDRNRILSATATLGAWSEADADEDLTEDETKLDVTIDEYGVRNYKVETAAALQALNAWMTAPSAPDPSKGIDEVPPIPNLTDRLKTNITLTADIQLPAPASDSNSNWTPIGTNSTTPYLGIFDGGGHTLSGLVINTGTKTYYVGLFGSIGKDAEVKNLTLKGKITGSNIASIAGYNDGILTNCHNEVTIESSIGSLYMGGIVAENHGTISQCTNTASIASNSDNTGGIVGMNYDGIISQCTNAASVVSNNGNVGGIAGYHFNSSNTSTIVACSNTGNVKSQRDKSKTGGIVGYNIGNISPTFITACYNTGNVSALGSNSCAGGITGHNDYTALTACYSTGNVSIDTDSDSYSGGIAGWHFSNAISIVSCYWRYGIGAPTSIIGGIEYDGNITGITAYPIGSPASGYDHLTWNLALGTYENSGTGGIIPLNNAIYEWNSDMSSTPAATSPCKYAVNPAYSDDDARKAAAAGMPYTVPPLVLIEISAPKKLE